jgi:hypothetical protein
MDRKSVHKNRPLHDVGCRDVGVDAPPLWRACQHPNLPSIPTPEPEPATSNNHQQRRRPAKRRGSEQLTKHCSWSCAEEEQKKEKRRKINKFFVGLPSVKAEPDDCVARYILDVAFVSTIRCLALVEFASICLVCPSRVTEFQIIQIKRNHKREKKGNLSQVEKKSDPESKKKKSNKTASQLCSLPLV